MDRARRSRRKSARLNAPSVVRVRPCPWCERCTRDKRSGVAPMQRGQASPSPVRHGTVGDWRLCDEEFVRVFRLPGLAEKHDMLQRQNPHPRDRRISFAEESHTYTIDGCVMAPRSVTTLVHEYGYSFDPIAALAAMKAGARWEEKREQFVNSDGGEMTLHGYHPMGSKGGSPC